MMDKRYQAYYELTRRGFLRTGSAAMLLVTTSTFGCDALSTDPAANDGDRRPARTKGDEAPSLVEQVRAGTLPSIEQRLPKNPLVIQPTERTGVYGGTWHAALTSANEAAIVYVKVGYDGLVRWNPEWSEVIANAAESWEVGASGREYTVHLREGMKWSDGALFTADDVVFAYDDVLRTVNPIAPSWLAPGGEPGRVEKLNDHTVKFVFAEPTGTFLHTLAAPAGNVLTAFPRHYLEQFHEKYNSDVAQLAEQQGFSNWRELFSAKAGEGMDSPSHWQNPEIPTLCAWQVTEPLGASGTRLELTRNPYYWKIDPEGSQLPYIDRVLFELIETTETILLRTLEGQFTLPHVSVLSLRNKPVLARNREGSDYRFVDAIDSQINRMVISFNMNHEDLMLREIFQNKDFRIGLSYALNREEIINSTFQRQGEPWQVAPQRGSEFFDEELAKQYTVYDIARAEEHLDQAGYQERDSQGFRLRSDGERISFSVDVSTTSYPEMIPALELIKGYWETIGIEMHVKSETVSLFWERVIANKTDASAWVGGDGGGFHYPWLEPGYYLPFGTSPYASLWASWHSSGGQEGEAPPELVQRQMSLYDQVGTTVDEGRRRDLFKQILDITREQFYVIGTVVITEGFRVVQNDFHNVGKMFIAYRYPSVGPTRSEQYFIQQPN